MKETSSALEPKIYAVPSNGSSTFIGARYYRYRESVLSVYARYCELRDDNDQIDFVQLNSLAEQIRSGTFCVLIAGEVKAGKSTFINALLQEEILPTDALQATSAIIRIRKAAQTGVTVTYADGHVRRVCEGGTAEQARNCLSEVAALNPRYRHIPETLLDSLIAVGVFDDERQITPDLVAELEKRSGYKLQAYIAEMNAYLRERPKSAVPVDVVVDYPLKYAFEGFQLIDSPGVNALGGVQQRTFEFIKNANAIIFVQKIDTVGTISVTEFISEHMSDRDRDLSFLVLSHGAGQNERDKDRFVDHATQIYAGLIAPDRIVVVDSMAELTSQDLMLRDKLADELEEVDENRFSLFEKAERRARKQGQPTLHCLSEMSNFDALNDLVNDFSDDAPRLQMKNLISRMKRGYGNQLVHHDNQVGLLQQRASDPQRFHKSVASIRKRLEDLDFDVLDATHAVSAKFISGQSGAEWRKRLEDIKADFIAKVQVKVSESRLHTLVQDAGQKRDAVVKWVCEMLVADFGTQMNVAGARSLNGTAYKLPEVDLDAIAADARHAATRQVPKYETVYERHWYTLWLFKHEEKRVVPGQFGEEFDESSYWGMVYTNAIESLCDRISQASKVIEDLIPACQERIRQNYQDLVVRERQNLESIEQQALDNENLLVEIKDIQKKKEFIESALAEVNALEVTLG